MNTFPRFSRPDVHFFDSRHGHHMLVVDGSRVYDVDAATRADIEAALARDGTPALATLLEDTGAPRIDDAPPRDMPIRALSLAVAQKCNLGCGYCYAQGGDFGGPARTMDWPVAQAAIHRLLDTTRPGERVNLAFLGGEPLTNRALIRRATDHAAALARDKAVRIGFSITTNGTLITPDDGAFFRRHGFAVTVSLDGIGEVHDRLRPFKGGRGSYRRIIDRIRPLLARQGAMQLSARVTVTPSNLDLRETLDGLIDLGFHSVGFAPLLSAPGTCQELDGGELEVMLAQMKDCGREFQRRVLTDRPYPFANLESALWEIHRGTHRPYPCGAGAGYFGVSASGGLFACHRFVEDERGALGDVHHGLDADQRGDWLAERHVHRQEPCNRCWARYLCGGGCHHEVIYRGRPACDYIRGWLHYCLQVYVAIMENRPGYFALPGASGKHAAPQA